MHDDPDFSPFRRAISQHLGEQAAQRTSIKEEHLFVRRLCNELEAIADGLPRLPGAHQLASINAALRAGIPAHCAHEENRLRALLNISGERSDKRAIALERLAAEHSDNENLGQELADTLESVSEMYRVENPEALGLQIRLYFMILRRHLMWEDYLLEHIFTVEN